MIMGLSHGRLAQDILLAAGVVGVIFLVFYVPVRCFGLKSAKCQVALVSMQNELHGQLHKTF
jgi:hypothetical protein